MGRKIIIEAVESFEDLRFPYCKDPKSVGDWFVDSDGNHRIMVVGNDPFEDCEAFLFAIHELIEYKLCRFAGIEQNLVDEFDARFEGFGEPGEDENCPYFEQHRRAMVVEYILATWLGINKYDVRTSSS